MRCVWLRSLLSILQLNVSHTDISFFPFYTQKRWKTCSLQLDSCGLQIHLNVVIWIDLTWLVFKAEQCFTNTKEIILSHRSRLFVFKELTTHSACRVHSVCSWVVFVFIVFKRRSGLCCDVAVQARPERSRRNQPVWACIMICFVSFFLLKCTIFMDSREPSVRLIFLD